MARLLFHIITGPDEPTKPTLGLLVASAAAAEGHEVDVFFAGAGVYYVQPATRDASSSPGLGNAGEHYAALVQRGAGLWVSGKSAEARDVASDGNAELSPPPKLVALMAAADNVITY
jgi:predicted peroxiredoxin